MEINENGYHGEERREFCSQHCIVAEQSKRSVPRWVFTASLSAMVLIALTFAGWQISAISEFKKDIQTSLDTLELRLDLRMENLKEKYNEDVRRFYTSAERNERLLTTLSDKMSNLTVRVGEIGTKQDLVVEKIQLAK